ncbi:hypothetical protein SRHO_G00046510 [Serrasalmus rhombeus]
MGSWPGQRGGAFFRTLGLFTTLNSKTIPDQYTTPRIDDALDCLAGSQWFSVLDLRSGYYQIAMAEQDKEKTAFICPLGFYQFERMPQGVTGAPATFQRLMEKAVGDMHMLQVLVYLDDLIVFGATLEEHEEILLKVLDHMEEVGLKISLDKCQFCQYRVKHVGHIVSAEGVETDPDKIDAVATWPQPTDLKSLRSFLGFCGYYRRFVAGYSSIVKPLTDLTKGYPPAKKGKVEKRKTTGDCPKPQAYHQESEPFGERWTAACTQAFHDIIHRLTHAPVLAFADPKRPYVLHVDASMNGLGAVLNQEYPEGLKPVAFASRSLSGAERNYHIHQLQFLALKWAIVDKFHDYLYGVKLRTDNNPLTYVLTSAKLNATGHRKQTVPEPWKEISLENVRAICTKVEARNVTGEPVCLAEELSVSSEGIPTLYAFPTQLELGQLEQLTMEDLRKAQADDAVIREVL